MRRPQFLALIFAAATILRTGAQLSGNSPPDTQSVPGASTDAGTGADTAVSETAASQGAAAWAALSSLEKKALPLEIAVASYYDLVAMTKKLGLPQTGTAGQLRERLYAWYGIQAPVKEGGNPVVVIEKADKASLFRIEGMDGPLVKISGGVRLSVQESDGTTHRISARSITYDRDRNAISASGGVRYERESGSSVEVFTGSTVVADLDDWAGVFVDGSFSMPGSASRSSTGSSATTSSSTASSTVQSLLGTFGSSSSGLTVAADRIIKRTGDVILVQNAEMTSCDDEEPHYVIRAGKAWLLGAGDWAVADASLFIGGLPVLWLPFFYYPSEEIVFHPVIGSRTREGRYIQTTTWLIGEKSVSSSAGSFLSIGLDQSKTSRSVEGVFFRTRSADAERGAGSASTSVPSTTAKAGTGQTASKAGKTFLKLLLDAYSNLGIYSGLEGSFPDRTGKNSLSFTAGLGLSRSLFYTSNGTYSPFSAASDWQSVWNTTDLGFATLPFRFGAELKSTFFLPIGKTGLTGTVSIPAFSDPYFEQDFRGRAEDMEWLKLFSSTTTDSARPSKRSSLVQKIELTGALLSQSPGTGLLSGIDLSKLGMSATWYTKTASYSPALTGTAASLEAVNPQRSFFYPDTLRFFDFSTTLKGNLITFPATAGRSGSADTGNSSDFRTPSQGDGNAASSGQPKDTENRTSAGPEASTENPTAKSPDAETKTTTESSSSASSLDFRVPGLAGTTKTSTSASSSGKPFSFSADWNFTPTAFFEDRFLSDSWGNVSDIDYSLYYSLLSLSMTGGVDAKAGLFDDLATVTAGIGVLGQYRLRPYFNDTRSDTSTINSLILSDYQYQLMKITSNFKTSLMPLKDNWLWGLSSIAYSISSNLYAYTYSGMSDSGLTGTALYDSTFASWDRDSITAHNASVTFAIRPAGLTQQLSLTANLPPLDETYTLKLDLDAGLAKFNLQGQATKVLPATVYSLNPLTAGITLGSGAWPRLSSTLVYNIQGETPDSFTTSLSWKAFTSSLVYKYSSGYVISSAHTWVSDGTQSFRAESFTAGLNPSFSSKQGAKNPWSVSLNAGLTQNLVRFSESKLQVGLSSKISLGKNFSLSFSGTSQNTAAWRYYTFLFQPSGGFDPADYSRNIFSDVIDSLTVWDSTALKRSLMKLSTLSVSMQQNLHDWDLGATVSAAPLLVEPTGAKPYYTLEISLSILVKWHDIPGISTTITKDSSGLSY